MKEKDKLIFRYRYSHQLIQIYDTGLKIFIIDYNIFIEYFLHQGVLRGLVDYIGLASYLKKSKSFYYF